MSASVFFASSLVFSIFYLTAPDGWFLDPFGFRNQSLEVLWESIWMFCLIWGAAMTGHVVAGRQSINGLQTTNPARSQKFSAIRSMRKSGILPPIIFFTLTTYIVSKILFAADTIGSTGLDQRVFIDKSSQYVLLAFGASAYRSMTERGAVFRTSVEILLMSACLLIAIVDMSREALIPAGFMLAFYLQRTDYRRKIMLWFFACSILLSLVMLRRDLSLSDAIQQPLDVLIVYLVEAIGYITAFNLLHFGQVVTERVDTGFTWIYLVLSVTPLPSSMIGAEILESRNFDAFRPYGASADMLFLSPFVLFVYWMLFGWAARISTRKAGILRVVLAALLLIVFVTSFQYSLRTSSKFLIIVLLLLGAHSILTRRDTRRLGVKTVIV